MNGAEALLETLNNAGVEVVFANPGTSEMQFVAALDKKDDVRAILALFEGVVTGAADGYGRMRDKPAATLLHLGPGLANGDANLHNARRARSPIINIVGDHADYHLELDAPLTSDIDAIASAVSFSIHRSTDANDLAQKGAEAFTSSMTYPGAIATIVAPANHAWEEAAGAVEIASEGNPPTCSESALAEAAKLLRADGSAALFLGGMALRDDALNQAGRIAACCGAKLICETFPARIQRGAGRVPAERLPYFAEGATQMLEQFENVILVGATSPVAFFAYPDKPGALIPEQTNCYCLATPREDAYHALSALAELLGAPRSHELAQPAFTPPAPEGPLEPSGVAAVLAELMPEHAIVSDEAATAGFALYPMTAGTPAHDWMTLTGGSIGQGLPLAVGAAVACPERKIICLEADGSAMYTLQALWTMARENLDVTTIILNNSSYAILNIEYQRVGGGEPGATAKSLLDLTNPTLDWVNLSEGMGVPAERARTVEEFRTALSKALYHRGPRLVEAIIPS